MTSEFTRTALGTLLSFSNGKSRPGEKHEGKFSVYGSNGSIGKAAESNSPAKSLIIGRVGSYCGSVHFSKDPCWVTDNAIRAVAKAGNDPFFLFYMLKHLNLNNWRSGSGQPLLNQNTLNSIEVHIPPPISQRGIGELLWTLDGRIASLRETNTTLESIAQALFKSWFVDFDPVRAKQEGSEPKGMDAETAALFPDSLEETELGVVPKGWQSVRLDAIAAVIMGLSPKGDSYNNKEIGVPLINGPVEFGEYFPLQTKWTDAATRLTKVDDLIFCVRGSTTGRRVVSDGEYCIGRGVCAIRAEDGSPGFTYQAINFGLDRLLSKTTGSVFPNLSAPDIKAFQVLNPGQNMIRAYEGITRPLLQRVQQNHRQIQTLVDLRDALLPRLISGRLRLPDAEALAAEAAA